jgi:hypothetical protein
MDGMEKNARRSDARHEAQDERREVPVPGGLSDLRLSPMDRPARSCSERSFSIRVAVIREACSSARPILWEGLKKEICHLGEGPRMTC